MIRTVLLYRCIANGGSSAEKLSIILSFHMPVSSFPPLSRAPLPKLRARIEQPLACDVIQNKLGLSVCNVKLVLNMRDQFIFSFCEIAARGLQLSSRY